MFETAELGRHISKKAFSEAEPVLQTKLLEIQRAIREANVPVIILVSGVEGAGKGEVVNLLNKWLDAKTSGVINAGVPLTGFSDLIAQAGNPEIKWTLSATWSRGPMQVGFMTQYTDDVIQPTVLDAARNPWEVDSLQTYNLYAQYSLSGFLGGESSVRIGARNLTDEQPPLASGGYLGNLHQPQGRYSYASVRHSF
jgi:hypothetical protein